MTMEKTMKSKIQVHEKGESYGIPGKLVEVINCKCWAEAIGNFNPIFCRYKKNRCLVQSMNGDLSDPFRRTEEYLKTLYIEI